MNKKIISFVTAFFMIFTLFDFPAGAVNGFTIEDDTLKNYYGDGGDVVVPDGVKHIADMAFLNKSNITSVTLPEGIETIGKDAFNGCSNMTSINLPDSITSIGEEAFAYCSSLTAEITIPAGVTAIEPFVFDGCQNLQNVTFHDNVESIGEYSFRQCSMTSLHIPDSVKTIGASAFIGCGNLQTVNIPNGIETIEGGTFQWCRKLSSIEIPDSVKAIGDYAFNGCEALTSVTIPDSVEEIGEGAFLGCTGLTSINIPSSVTAIGNQAFYNCYALDMITYPKGLDISGAWFTAAATKVEYTVENGEVTITDIILGAGTGKTEVEIPETINGVPVTSVNESVRDKVSESGHVHRYVDGICTMCNKPEFDYKVINENEIRIDGYNGSNTEVVIPETIDGKPVTTIYELNGGSVTKVTIPKSVKMIYGAAFNYNKPSSLAEICFDGFSDGFVTVGTSAFPDTVTKITFPEGLNDNDVRKKMTLTVFPANAELFSGTEPLPHDYVYVPDGSVHYQKCDACGHVKEGTSEAHSPEGEFITDKPNYNYEKYHYQTCKCGLVMGAFHEWDEGSITTQATCTSPGVMTYICTCGAVKTEEISKLPHSYENGSCTVCGAKDPDYSQLTETTPDDTEPPVTNPSDTEPPVTAPPVTDPSGTEPPVTVPPVTAPVVTYPAETAPSNGYPLVIPYGYTASSNEKIFEALAGASDGDTVVVNLNGNTSVDKSVFDEIKGRDVTVRFRLKGGAYWTINGKDIEQSRKVDLGVRMNRMSAPRDEIKELAGDKKTVKFTLSHNGKLGFSGILNIPVNEKYNGKYANLYYYGKGFEFAGSSLISDGYAQFRFDHASEYIIVIDDYPHGEDISAAAGAQCDDTPIDGSGHEDSGKAPAYFTDENKIRITNRKRRYRILKRRRLEDIVFLL